MAEDNEFITTKDLEELLSYKFGNSVKVESFTAVPLTKPGENYGSNILAVDVVLKDKFKKLSIVVKLVPVSPFLRMVFQCGLTVRKEMDMYLLVSPEYDKIQKENNISNAEFLDVFPECYGARATKEKDVGQPADEGSAIVLENLKISGYDTGDRIEGFDLAHTKYILMQLSRFHATAVAIKLKKPEVFERTVKKACTRMVVSPPPSKDGENPVFKASIDLLKMTPGCEKYIDKVTKLVKEHEKIIQNPESQIPSEPFASICHNDFWTNNMMVTYGTSFDRTAPRGLKIVDYQVTSIDSPVKDLIFFLYTSTQRGLVEKHYNEFINHYHKYFVEQLHSLGCDVEDFSFRRFLEEIEKFAPTEFIHIFFMLKPLNLKKENAVELADFDGKLFESNDASALYDSYFVRLKFLVDDFTHKGWI